MLNANKLRGKIIERGLSIGFVAQQIGVHKSTFYRKLSGECQFTIKDADIITKELNLSTEDAVDIFFGPKVAEMRITRKEVS